MATDRSDETLRLRATLATIAPGTPLRDGLERILRGRTGALIVLGHDKVVESIATGGFTLDVPFTATGLRELAKMDGAIIVDKDVTRILRAAVHLMPDHTIPSEETGTRHRTADRVARQTGFPVISVSQSMQIIAAYVGETRHVLEDSGQILSRANQALATLERYKLRLDEVSEHPVRAGDRGPGHGPRRRRGRPAAGDGHPDRQRDRGLRPRARHRRPAAVPPAGGADHRRRHRARAGDPRLPARRPPLRRPRGAAEPARVAVVHRAGRPGGRRPRARASATASTSTARSRRAATGCSPRCPRLPPTVVDRLVDHFGTLQKLLSAGVDDLQAVDGVGELRARSVREGLSRLAESTILERYV